MIKNFLQRFPFLFSLLILLFIMPLFYLISSKNIYAIGEMGYYSYSALAEFFSAFLILVIIRQTNLPVNLFNQNIKTFINGIFLGSIMFLYLVGTLIIGFLNYGINNIIIPDFSSVFSLLIMMFSVGFFEELLCRGVLLHVFLIKWGKGKNGIYTAVIISSAIFGSLHLINLFIRPTLLFFTIAQAIYTTIAGIFFAAIYLRCKNLWSSIFYHSLHDICTGIFYILLPAEKLTSLNVHYAAGSDQSISQGIFLILAATPLTIIALVLLRKVSIYK